MRDRAELDRQVREIIAEAARSATGRALLPAAAGCNVLITGPVTITIVYRERPDPGDCGGLGEGDP